MNAASDIHIILCTVPDTDTGRRIADQLLEYRLAACVNLIAGVESIYSWNGELHHDTECLLMIKKPAVGLRAARTDRSRAAPLRTSRNHRSPTE